MRRPIAGMLVTLAAVLATALPAQAGPREPIRSDGRWLVDRAGRVVIFHGVNIVPPGPGDFPQAAGIGARHLRFLARQGFRLVRYGGFYADVEPHPGTYGRDALRRFTSYERRIARARMFTLFDVHQDLYSPKYGGRGFPDWMVYDDGVPNQVNPGFPAGYLANPAANRAYDNFWDNHPASDGAGIQAHFAAGWRRLASRFAARSRGRLLGYEILNEPWPGSAWPSCANLAGCPPGGFDQTQLTDFTRRVVDSIRQVDRRRIVFFEPNLQFDFGADTGLGDPRDSNVGFSFHDYCLGTIPGAPAAPDPFGLCEVGEGLPIQHAESYAQRTGATPLLTEFGDTHDPSVHERVTEAADRHLLSWTAWAYWAANGQIVEDPSKPPTPGNLDQGLLDALVRPYPYVVAGTPASFAWHRKRGRFRLRYLTELPDGGRAARHLRTEVIAPRRCFPHGYRVRVAGARVVSRRDAPVLKLRRDRGAGQVRIEVQRRP